jgi:glutaconate CoA-transferase subunit B
MVSGAGRDPDQWPEGQVPELLFGLVISNLGVFDFEAPVGQMRIRSLHPGVQLSEVLEQTGFPLVYDDAPRVTPMPTEDQLALIRGLDPHDFRSKILKGNPIVEA